jgi:hypothetical protein
MRDAHREEKKQYPLKSSKSLAGLGETDEDPLIVVVPISAQVISSPKKRALEITSNRTEQLRLSFLLREFYKAKFLDKCISNDQFFPYPQEEVKRLFVRRCYADIFDLIILSLKEKVRTFGISGTPGVGKSSFFAYLLFRFITDSEWQPKIVVYQKENCFYVYNFDERSVYETTVLDGNIISGDNDRETFYLVDGQNSVPRISTCTTMFISSPRSSEYKEFVKQRKAREWFFPVWSISEVSLCRMHCYPGLSIVSMQKRFNVYGGIARYIFFDNGEAMHPKMKNVLCDLDAIRGVKSIGVPSNIYRESHTLLHMIVGDDEYNRPYQFLGMDLASKYVGEQLWIKYSAEMVTNLQEMFGGSPSEISRHLYEIYAHLKLRQGGFKVRVKNLEKDEGVFDLEIVPHGSLVHVAKNSISSIVRLDASAYYEASDDNTFPAIDSFSFQGMFQISVAQEHPIRGVQTLRKICGLFSEPKLYFVVPPHRFDKFKKQNFLGTKGNTKVKPIVNLQQYVMELPVHSSKEAFHSTKLYK